jgi:hypothetical protein
MLASRGSPSTRLTKALINAAHSAGWVSNWPRAGEPDGLYKGKGGRGNRAAFPFGVICRRRDSSPVGPAQMQGQVFGSQVPPPQEYEQLPKQLWSAQVGQPEPPAAGAVWRSLRVRRVSRERVSFFVFFICPPPIG